MQFQCSMKFDDSDLNLDRDLDNEDTKGSKKKGKGNSIKGFA